MKDEDLRLKQQKCYDYHAVCRTEAENRNDAESSACKYD